MLTFLAVMVAIGYVELVGTVVFAGSTLLLTRRTRSLGKKLLAAALVCLTGMITGSLAGVAVLVGGLGVAQLFGEDGAVFGVAGLAAVPAGWLAGVVAGWRVGWRVGSGVAWTEALASGLLGDSNNDG